MTVIMKNKLPILISIVSLLGLCISLYIIHMQQNYIQSLDSQLTLLEERHDAFIKKKYQPLDAKVEDLERRIEDVNDQALDLQSDLDDAHSRIDRVADDAWNAQMDADTANFENDDLRDQLNATHRYSYY